ncbi:hypothetical protein M427DRAFT_92655 [Gonapodya prolifera JEL478]|uniref:Fatty acid hydroxylase domain-containing protein n=1 Tax=Gonapodya prolifera (strain JEL478) TaxID=1344416 RepID=A0A139AZ42_GONPJ|nr:hypothetical protein M427DRAFT_92655 [Gonapodya prolifera JEL478]|eukprot:KXS22022.1 hypothetical protein M427DRAFT_92655 [Gonapodya prolifera JEL478]
MDDALAILDHYIFNTVYATYPFTTPSLSPYFSDPSNVVRQSTSLFVFVYIGAWAMYLSCAGLSYWFLFDHNLKKHPKFLKNQVQLELWTCFKNFHYLVLYTVPWFVGEVRGYSKLYERIEDHPWGWWYIPISVVWFLVFTDWLIYWAHRFLHHPWVYPRVHKVHHMWKVPTPFASHAFNALDGYMQSLPYHLFAFLFPLQKYVYLILFVGVNIWTISIHDQLFISRNHIINSTAHHTIHHRDFNYNFGQYFTFWDWISGTYRDPLDELKFADAVRKTGEYQWTRARLPKEVVERGDGTKDEEDKGA